MLTLGVEVVEPLPSDVGWSQPFAASFPNDSDLARTVLTRPRALSPPAFSRALGVVKLGRCRVVALFPTRDKHGLGKIARGFRPAARFHTGKNANQSPPPQHLIVLKLGSLTVQPHLIVLGLVTRFYHNLSDQKKGANSDPQRHPIAPNERRLQRLALRPLLPDCQAQG